MATRGPPRAPKPAPAELAAQLAAGVPAALANPGIARLRPRARRGAAAMRRGDPREAVRHHAEAVKLANEAGLGREAAVIAGRGRYEFTHTREQLTSVLRHDGSPVAVEYERRGRVARVVDPAGFGTRVQYDRDGRVAAVHIGLVGRDTYKNDILHLLDGGKATSLVGGGRLAPALFVGTR